MCTSRVDVDQHGRRVVTVTSADAPGLEVGSRYIVLGDEFPAGAERGIQWTGTRTGYRNPVTVARRNNRDPLPVEMPAR